MNVSSVAATCPSCGTPASVFAIYVRSGDELVCPPCRGSVSSPPIEQAPLPRQSCETTGCDAGPVYTITRDDRFKKVCRNCMTEMTGLWGWGFVS